MLKIILNMTLLLAFVFATAGPAMAAEEEKNSFIPDTVSKEARKILEETIPGEIKAKTKEEWQKVWRQHQDGFLPVIEKYKKKYPAKMEDVEIAGWKHLLITPNTYDPVNGNRLIIYVHGGGYTLYDTETSLNSSLVTAHYSRCRILAVNYPMAWEKPYPAQRDVVVAVYKKMLEKYRPQCIAMYGESAGGGLVMTSVLKIRDDGTPMPAVLGLISPWADLSHSGDSQTIIEGYDPVLNYEKNLKASALVYAGGRDLKDPGVSPIYADYKQGFPPSYISTGTRDLLQSHCARLQRKLTDAGVENRLYLEEGMWHVFQAYPIPEAEPAWLDMIRFFEQHWGR